MNEMKLNTPVMNTAAVSPSAASKASSVYNAASKPAEVNASKATSGKELPPPATNVTGLNREQVQDAVSRINEYVQQTERTLSFRLDEDSGQTVISVYDKASEELIRQIPSELALQLAQKLNDEEPSLLFRAQV